MYELRHLVSKAQEAASGGFDVLSTGEKIAAALILNRADLLASIGYTIPEALDRLEPEWIAMIPAAAKAVAQAASAIHTADKTARAEMTIETDCDVTDAQAKLVTYGESPGYRDISLTIDVKRIGSDKSYRWCLRFDAQDTETIAQHIKSVHSFAWNRGRPIDVKPGEQRPVWLG